MVYHNVFSTTVNYTLKKHVSRFAQYPTLRRLRIGGNHQDVSYVCIVKLDRWWAIEVIHLNNKRTSQRIEIKAEKRFHKPVGNKQGEESEEYR